MIRRILYALGIGTLLQRSEWERQHSAKYQIRKIKRGLESGNQHRSMIFEKNYPQEVWDAPIGYEYYFDYPDRNAEIISYFTRKGYSVAESSFGANLFIYKVGENKRNGKQK